MPRDHNTAGYRMEISVIMVEVNKYGDELTEGSLHFTKTLKVHSLTELAKVLEAISNLDFRLER